MWGVLGIYLGVWLPFLMAAIWYLSRSRDRSAPHFLMEVREHLPAPCRAKVLLRDMLSESQYQQLATCGYLDVVSPSQGNRVYRIPGGGGLVRVYEGGCAVMDLCVQPVDPLPHNDVVVMHKLMIEGNEQEYLQKANHFTPGVISPACQHL